MKQFDKIQADNVSRLGTKLRKLSLHDGLLVVHFAHPAGRSDVMNNLAGARVVQAAQIRLFVREEQEQRGHAADHCRNAEDG